MSEQRGHGPTEQREWGEGWPKGLSVSYCDVCDDPDDLLKVPDEACRHGYDESHRRHGVIQVVPLSEVEAALDTPTESAPDSEVRELRELLREALDEYADHQSWRCGHPDRYPLDEVDPPDCPCGLHQFSIRARRALAPDPEGGTDG